MIFSLDSMGILFLFGIGVMSHSGDTVQKLRPAITDSGDGATCIYWRCFGLVCDG